MKILIADADIKTRNELEYAVTKARSDSQVSLVDTGRDLISKLNSQQWDAVFIDTALPQTDAKQLKNILGIVFISNKTRIILQSEIIRSNWISIASLFHAYEFLFKPYQQEKIERLLKSAKNMNDQKNILIVETSDQLRNIYKTIIENSAIDAKLVEAASARRALTALSKQEIDVVILSKNLNDMPTLEAAYQISSRHQDNLPIILINDNINIYDHKLQKFGIKAIVKETFEAFDVNISVHEALGIWKPYLYNAIRRNYTV